MALFRIDAAGDESPRPLGTRSRIAAIVPHYKCERWLAQSLESLLAQTRPLDAIVVVDDGSDAPPLDIVREFPSVTLLRSEENVGWSRVLQQAIDDTDFDGYMIQDADDWSGPRRLEWLLDEAERTGAELVGCQEMRMDVTDMVAEAHWYPADVNGTVRSEPGTYALLHPSSIVSRDLVVRIGGYPTGMRFAGDAEFQRRAVHAALVRNIPTLCYFRRTRPGALTTAPDTGDKSEARAEVRRILTERSERAVAAVLQRLPVDLTPLVVAPPIELHHIGGPSLENRRTPDREETAASHPHRQAVREIRSPEALRAMPVEHRPPVFILGAPGAGVELVHAALAQHPAFAAVHGSAYFSRQEWDTGARMGRVVDGSTLYCFEIEKLLTHHPDARFIHVVRNPEETIQAAIRRGPLEDAEAVAAAELQSWLRHTKPCLEAEASLGSETVIRVDGTELLSRVPLDRLMRNILRFLGEEQVDACARVLCADDRPADGGSELEPDAASGLDAVLFCARVSWEQLRSGSLPPETAPGLPALISPLLPSSAVPVVFSYGDERLVKFGSITGQHFPQDETGGYTDAMPSTSAEAVGMLDRLRAAGATHVVIPRSAAWWLSSYPGLQDFLQQHSRLFAFYREEGMVFELSPTG